MSKTESHFDEETGADMRTEVEITLSFPITVEGQKITSLTMRRPKTADRLWAEKQKSDDFAKIVSVAARLCNVAPADIAELDDLDMKKVDDQYAAFRGDKASEGA